ncbi:MAG: dihydropteroate synthase [Planctomycetes bacterium]|nr:dihydropteroate synthase [Planctomycetota bacterium]
MPDHIHFVTGRLAEHALRDVLEKLRSQVDFDYSVDVLPITVAALMTPRWIADRIRMPSKATRVVVPGYCEGDLQEIEARVDALVSRGPKDLRRLPEFFGGRQHLKDEIGAYDIEILAEINHAPRMSLEAILAEANQLQDAGADLIDVGCEPGDPWLGVSDCVKALRDVGHRVSIDSLNPIEIEPAVRAGAELVLSVNSTNRDAACDWGCEVVVIPDDFATLGELDATIDQLATAGVPLRIDPILEPIGCGFAASLGRYLEVRRRYPDAEMLMGIGNVTELTDADSAAINLLLLGVCQELGIRSVLTTQVIDWARTSVRECDLARRMVYYAVRQGVPPKHVGDELVMLRDVGTRPFGNEQLARLASAIKDNNYRLFAEDGEMHIVSSNLHLRNADPFELFEKLLGETPKNLDASHAFYLGFELSKALTALTLDKQYEQDQALDWGFLTRPEAHHRLKRGKSAS